MILNLESRWFLWLKPFVSVEQYCIWTDGLSALLGKELGSDLTRSDLDTLMSMEMKLRLLDLENITIPEAPPPVPKEPSTYNFTYNYGWDVCPFNQCFSVSVTLQRWSVSLRYFLAKFMYCKSVTGSLTCWRVTSVCLSGPTRKLLTRPSSTWTKGAEAAEMTHFTFKLVYVPILHMNYESIFSVPFQMFVRQKNKRFFCLQVFESKKSPAETVS